MVKKILGWLIDSELIEEQEREIIEYGLEQGCCAIGGIIVAVVTGALLNML
ncbi:MAG: accessory gene regulator B family protein [Anaerostipes sp.]|nr:accessory gene regulator B family protein [Anaerostipes sp.]